VQPCSYEIDGFAKPFPQVAVAAFEICIERPGRGADPRLVAHRPQRPIEQIPVLIRQPLDLIEQYLQPSSLVHRASTSVDRK
jgi:hypothetical protein